MEIVSVELTLKFVLKFRSFSQKFVLKFNMNFRENSAKTFSIFDEFFQSLLAPKVHSTLKYQQMLKKFQGKCLQKTFINYIIFKFII